MSNPEKRRNNRKLIIIFIIIFTEVLGFSMVLPVLPFLATSLGLNPFQIGLVLSVFSFCQLFASPITGKLSDRFGRKPVLILSQISTLIGFLLLGIADNIWLLVSARLIDGLLGSNMTVSQAYIRDVTDPEDLTKNYGYSSAVFGASLIFGPVIGGTLSTFNYSIPMFFAAGVSLLSILLVSIFLPESLINKKKKVKITFNEIIPIKETKRFFKTPKVRGALLLFFIYSFGFMLFISTFALFAEKQLQINAQEVGFYMAWIGILRVVFQSFFIPLFLKHLGERNTLRIGISSMIVAMIFIALSVNYLFVFIPLIFLALGTGVSRPILTSMLTKSVKKEESGSLLGVNNSLSSFGQIITPIIGGAMIQSLPSPFLPALSTVFYILIFVFWRWTITKPNNDDKK